MPEPQANDPQPVLARDRSEALGPPTAPVPAAAPPADTAIPPRADPAPRRFGFRSPSFLAAAVLRRLRMRHEEFVRSVMTRLSVYLRLEVGVRLTDLQTLSYRRFFERLPSRTHLTLFRLESFEGLGLLEIPPPLGLAIVDRLFGGAGRADQPDRDFSEIEIEVLDLVVQLILKEWSQEVTRRPEVRPQRVSHETNPRYLPWSDPDTNLLLVTLSVSVNETVGELKLAVPRIMIEPLQRQLDVAPEAASGQEARPATEPHWHPGLDEVPVLLQASWADLELTARELAQLKVGDVLQVSPHLMNRVQICVGQLPKFRGRLGTCDQGWAVELTGTL